MKQPLGVDTHVTVQNLCFFLVQLFWLTYFLCPTISIKFKNMNDESSEFAERYYTFLQNAQDPKYDQSNEPLSDLLSIQEREFFCAILKQAIDELVLINFKAIQLSDKDIQAKQNLDQIMGVKFEQDV